jgi:hypothetical protein
MGQLGVAFDLASFKNSREYARKATTTALTSQLVVAGNLAAGPTLIAFPDNNRTYLTLRNLNSSKSFPLGADGLKYFYQKSGDPNPTIAQILANGFELDPGDAIDMESPEATWAVSMTANPVPITIDVGDG